MTHALRSLFVTATLAGTMVAGAYRYGLALAAPVLARLFP